MGKQQRRIRVLETGILEVIDPSYDDDLQLLTAIDPEFEIHETPLAGFIRPRAVFTAANHVPLDCSLDETSDTVLWAVHDRALAKPEPSGGAGVSLLAVKAELARRMLAHCTLCARNCRVNRLAGERGVCKLGANAQVVEHFVHIGEEPPINPSLMISLEGCGLRCKYCQQFPLLEPGTLASEPLKAGFWGMLDARHARSMSFIGGNPDESLAGILAFLVSIPGKWKLPIVWNNHAYSTPAALRLLHGVVDAYVPDFKYANDACGLQLSGVKSYAEVAANTIRAMLGQQVPVFVRLLVLPGHLQCCHLPAVRTLSSMNSEHLFVSLRGQYSPDHGVLNCDGSDRALLQLSRRPSGYEIAEVRSAVVSSGLRLVQSGDVAEYVNTCAGSG